MKGEWWEILIAVVVVTIAVWIKGEVEQQRLAEHILRQVMEMWLSGQGPPSLYIPANPRKTQPPQTTE